MRELRCSCGADTSTDGFRFDVVCEKHDGPFEINGVPVIRRSDLTIDSDPAYDFDGPDPFASLVEDA